MEPLIEKIDRTICAEQWRQARVRIDQTALQRNLDSIMRITSDFVQESSATNGFQAWTNLKPLIYFLLQELDDTGISQIIGDDCYVYPICICYNHCKPMFGYLISFRLRFITVQSYNLCN
jgi:hypothetical protein